MKILRLILLSLLFIFATPNINAYHYYHFHHTKVHHRNKSKPAKYKHHYRYESNKPRNYWTETNTARLIIHLYLINNHKRNKEEYLIYRVYFKDGDVIDYKVDKKNEYILVKDAVEGLNRLLRKYDCEKIDLEDVNKITVRKE